MRKRAVIHAVKHSYQTNGKLTMSSATSLNVHVQTILIHVTNSC